MPVVHVLVHVKLAFENLVTVRTFKLRASHDLLVLLVGKVHVLFRRERARRG